MTRRDHCIAWSAGIIVALGFLAFLLSSAKAATVAEFDACRPDAERLCGPLSDGLFARTRIFVCMLGKRDVLSAKCRAVFRAHGF